MKLFFDSFPISLGLFSIAVNDAGAICATAFGDESALRGRLRECHLIGDVGATAPAREQILAYFAGERREFSLPLAPHGTPFQQQVWASLQRIPFGETLSYGQLAASLGRPSAARAVGRANATNPICLIVPCHRVVGADGSLTGFAFGDKIKRQLLSHEGAHFDARDRLSPAALAGV